MINENIIEDIKQWIKDLFKIIKEIPPSCPIGYAYNELTLKCEKELEPDTCPLGYTLDLYTNNCIKIPDSIDMSDVPLDAFYLQPDENNDFTQSMFLEAIANGNKYIVVDALVWNIIYENSPLQTPVEGRKKNKIYFNNIHGSLENPIIIDCRKVFINCYHDRINFMDSHIVFTTENTSNIYFRFNHVEGDKYKRAFSDETNEKWIENTSLVSSFKGSQYTKIKGNYISGFTADAFSSSSYPSKIVNRYAKFTPIGDDYWQSVWMPLTELDNLKYKTLSFSTGIGYARIPSWDMFNFTAIFLDQYNEEIERLTNCEFLKGIVIPLNARKVSIIFKSTTGTRLKPGEISREFDFPFGYAVTKGFTVYETTITDNHRGGVSNLGPYAVIDNCTFYNTQRYFDSKKYPDSTKYEINCEDSVSKELQITNNNIIGKFHSILLITNVSANVSGNTITGNYAIVLKELIEGTISNNKFDLENKNILDVGYGNNEQKIKIFNNLGKVTILGGYSSEIYNNEFNDSIVTKYGLIHDNIFNNSNFEYFSFSKNVYNNIFNGLNSNYSTSLEDMYVYKNTFIDCNFSFAKGFIRNDKVIVFNECNFSGKNIKNGIEKISFSKYQTVLDFAFLKCNFDNQNFKHERVNVTSEVIESNWYFEDCNFTNMNGLFFDFFNNNTRNIEPIIVSFSNCNFEGDGLFHKIGYYIYSMNIEFTFHNCTFDSRLILPNEYNTEYIPLPDVTPKSFYPKFTSIKYDIDNQKVDMFLPFKSAILKVRKISTQEIQTLKSASAYYYYLDGQDITDFEFSIDHGETWEKPII